jgi:hypothetical protein
VADTIVRILRSAQGDDGYKPYCLVDLSKDSTWAAMLPPDIIQVLYAGRNKPDLLANNFVDSTDGHRYNLLVAE